MYVVAETEDKRFYLDYDMNLFYMKKDEHEMHPVNGDYVPEEISKKLSEISRTSVEVFYWCG